MNVHIALIHVQALQHNDRDDHARLAIRHTLRPLLLLRLAPDDGAQVADRDLDGEVDGGEQHGEEDVPARPAGDKGGSAGALCRRVGNEPGPHVSHDDASQTKSCAFHKCLGWWGVGEGLVVTKG